MSPLPPPPAPANIEISNGMPGTLAAGGGGGQVKAAGQCNVVIEGDADGVFSVASLETLAMIHPPDAPPGSGRGWQTVDSVVGAGPIGLGPAGFLRIQVQFACPVSPAKETYTATAVAVLEGSQRQVLGVPITASVATQQLAISVLQGPSTFNPGQTQDFVILLNSSFRVDIEGAFGLQYLNTPFDEVAITNNFPALPALGDLGITVSVKCDPDTAAGNYQLTFLYSAISGPAPSQTFTANVEVIVPTPPAPPDPRKKDHFDAVYVAGSTQRICQLTGGGDPQNLPHPNDTTRFSLLGTDLGTSFDQVVNGEHRTYFFFGDTTTKEGDSTGDAIAYTTDDQPAPEGLHLQFIMGDEQWRRLIIPGVSLEAFEVPSGGFSCDGRIYVFATTNYRKINGVDCMEDSVLASAIDAHNDFDLAYYVSHRDDSVDTPSMGGKFINVSPFVINYNDWPGLPDNEEFYPTGLLMAGSGAYRRSAPYLAYAPLPYEQGPAQSEWRYLQGFEEPWEPGYGPSGRPIWSNLESDAMLMFDAQIGEISYSFHAGLGRWLLVYNGCASGDCGIVLRSAPMPWGPWSEPQLIFSSSFTNTLGEKAQGAYMFECGPYGAYVISRYNSWDPASQQATFYFTLSNGCCLSGGCSEPRYQVHQMRTMLQLVSVP